MKIKMKIKTEDDLTRREQSTNNDMKSVRLEREERYRADLLGISA